MKEGNKNLKTSSVYRRFWSIYKTMSSYCLKCKRNTVIKNPKAVRTKKRRIIFIKI